MRDGDERVKTEGEEPFLVRNVGKAALPLSPRWLWGCCGTLAGPPSSGAGGIWDRW